MIRLPLLALLLSAGCSDMDLAAEKAGGDADSTNYADTDDTGDDDLDSGPETDPAWYVVRADLTVAGGLPDAAGAVVSVDVVDADLLRTDCTVELAADGVIASEVATAEATTLWWEVPVVPANEACAPLPDELILGVGAMHPDVRAQLGTVGNDDIADSLYGAYLALDGEIAAFGFAGTATDLLGDDVAVLPPPDGLYRLAPLYLVPLPE